jgi:hypothetical protein
MSVHETATKAVTYLSPIDELGQRDIPVVSEGMECFEARCSILEFETQKVPVGRRSTTTKLDREGRCVIRYCDTVHINNASMPENYNQTHGHLRARDAL